MMNDEVEKYAIMRSRYWKHPVNWPLVGPTKREIWRVRLEKRNVKAAA